LEETLDFLDKKVMVFVELKEMGLEEKVLALIKKKRLNKNVIVVSFFEDALKKVRLLDAEIQTGLIYAKHKNPLKAALDLKAQ
jgi:glycerophosphoryl diester phosphodiesterase